MHDTPPLPRTAFVSHPIRTMFRALAGAVLARFALPLLVALLLAFAPAVQATAAPALADLHHGVAVAGATPANGTVWRGRLIVASNMGVTIRLASGVRDLRAAPTMVVTRNGAPSSFNQLHSGDIVSVTTDASGAAIRVDATGPGAGAAPTPLPPTATATPATATNGNTWQGTLVAANNVGITARSGATVRDFRAAATARVTRNGQPSSLDALQPGDTVSVTTDASGAATLIAATSQGAAGQSATTATPTAPPAVVGGTVWYGTLIVASNMGITARLSSGVRDFRAAPTVRVTRDGQDSSLDQLQPGDTLIVTTDKSGAAVVIEAAQRSSAATATPAPAASNVVRGTLVAANDVGVTVRLAAGVHDYRAGPNLAVTRAGQPSSLDALQPGDSITIWIDGSGAMTALDATRPNASVSAAPAWHGVVAAVWGGGIAARDQHGVRDFRLAPSVAVHHNGQEARLDELEAGDAITVTTDADDRVIQVDAFSASASAPAGAGTSTSERQTATNAALALLVLTLLILGAVGLIQRRQMASAPGRGGDTTGRQ